MMIRGFSPLVVSVYSIGAEVCHGTNQCDAKFFCHVSEGWAGCSRALLQSAVLDWQYLICPPGDEPWIYIPQNRGFNAARCLSPGDARRKDKIVARLARGKSSEDDRLFMNSLCVSGSDAGTSTHGQFGRRLKN